jgi:hypothetical protein
LCGGEGRPIASHDARQLDSSSRGHVSADKRR